MSLLRISRKLGLSITTVSRALGGYRDVADATRARVVAEAARISYQPSRIARQFRTGRAGAVGIVLPSGPGQFTDPFFLEMLSVIGPRLAAAELDLMVTSAKPGEDELRAHRQMIDNRRVDAMLLARTRCNDARIGLLLDRGMPFVAHGRSDEARRFAWVDIDGEAAVRDAMARLLELGHRRIGLINASPEFTFARHRRQGWLGALRDAGLAPGPEAAVMPSEEAGFMAAAAMLRLEPRPTAILCATDRIAVGCLHALADAGLRAGRDVSVIGYDNLPSSGYTDPPLTTVAQPIAAAAACMVDMLLAQLGGADTGGQQVLLTGQLVLRGSDAAPAAADLEAVRGTIRAGGPNKTISGGQDDVEDQAVR